MNIDSIVQAFAVYALPVLFAITVHEAAHGYVARRLGDNTAFMLGRVTLNPVKHIDPIGTIALPILLLFSTGGQFLFGYAKPVPVRFNHLNNPKRDMVWVALAGPGSNFVMAFLWALLGIVLGAIGITDDFFQRMSLAGVQINLVLFALNLFPLLPLDGGRVLMGLLPYQAGYWMAQTERYGIFIIMGLLLFGALGQWWISPIMDYGIAFLRLVLAPVAALLPPS